MRKILVPVNGTHNCDLAVRHVVRQFMNNTSMEIHLLNVQPPVTASLRLQHDFDAAVVLVLEHLVSQRRIL